MLKHSGSKRQLIQTTDSYHYVPLLQSLTTLLSDSTVIAEVDRCNRMHDDGTLEDYCDGYLYQSHPLFSSDKNALQIIAFYDELELCNPLSTHVKAHKVGIVLFTLGNMHPRYRSSLKVIHIAIIATLPIIEKHGIDLV